jgi:predicted P-loop ATPase
MAIPDDLADELAGDWRSKLLITPTHTPKPSIANALIALHEAPEWQGVLAYNEFELVTIAALPPPWLRGANDWRPVRWGDREDVLTTDWLHHQKISVPVTETARAVETVAKDTAFHPVRDYLSGLQWDGIKRIDNFAATYLGAEPTPYHATVGLCTLVAAVARIMEPGCKADHVPILEGPQGTLKSTAIEILFAPWFTDDLAELGTKDAAMQIRGAWGIEIAELSAMTRGEVERVKAFVSRRVDRFRPSYGRRVIEAPRQCVFVGSTNAEGYLKDDTGARRFWPIGCGTIHAADIRRDRDQLWAETVAMYRDGMKWWLTNGEDVAAARQEQSDRYEGDPWDDRINEYIRNKTDVSTEEVLSNAVFVETARQTPADAKRVARILRNTGWVRRQLRPTCKRRFYRPEL